MPVDFPSYQQLWRINDSNSRYNNNTTSRLVSSRRATNFGISHNTRGWFFFFLTRLQNRRAKGLSPRSPAVWWKSARPWRWWWRWTATPGSTSWSGNAWPETTTPSRVTSCSWPTRRGAWRNPSCSARSRRRPTRPRVRWSPTRTSR